MEIPTFNELESQLFKAIRDGNLQVVQALIQKGVNLDCKNDYGQTPLHHAVLYEKVTIVELLLEKGANLDSKNKNGIMPLHHAAALGQESILETIYLII